MNRTSTFETKAFKENQQHYQTWTESLHQLRQAHTFGGTAQAKKKQTDRGKLLVRDRLRALLDPSSTFLELSLHAGHQLYPGIDLPAGGLITGIGDIHGRPCMIMANDPTIKGGTYFPITVKKHLRAQAIALRHRLPCVYLVDSGGAFLPLQHEVFPDRNDFGRIFYNEAQMSAQGIPQLAIVLGHCTAGGAYIPAMADEVIMVKKQSTIYLAGPPLVHAATGEVITDQALGGADVHCRHSGVADAAAQNESDALQMMREKIAMLPSTPATVNDFNAPLQPMQDITGYIPHDPRHLPDIDGILACILDNSALVPFKPTYGTTIQCGFAHIHGHAIGILANNGVLTSEAAMKATHFIQLCCQRQTPMCFFQNINGFLVGQQPEKQGIAKHGAKMVMAVANATVPKYTIMMGGSYGAGNYAMCGRAYDPDFLWQWPNAKTAVMGAEQATHVMQSVSSQHNMDLMASFVAQSTSFYGSARLWDDGIIHPSETRDMLAFALKISQGIAKKTTQFGVFRI